MEGLAERGRGAYTEFILQKGLEAAVLPEGLPGVSFPEIGPDEEEVGPLPHGLGCHGCEAGLDGRAELPEGKEPEAQGFQRVQPELLVQPLLLDHPFLVPIREQILPKHLSSKLGFID